MNENQKQWALMMSQAHDRLQRLMRLDAPREIIMAENNLTQQFFWACMLDRPLNKVANDG